MAVLFRAFLSLAVAELFLWTKLAWAATVDLDLAEYFFKVIIALVVMAAAGFLITRYFTVGKKGNPATEDLKIMASLPLGRDVLYVVRCGPDVIAIASGVSGSTVVGRWSLDDWKREGRDTVV